MSKESSDLVVIPAPHITGTMSKNRLMLYTFAALLAITVVSAALWSPITTPSGWNLGLTVAVCALIAVGIAVGLDILMHKLVSDSESNTWSAAVFGLIVTLSYSLGIPMMNTEVGLPAEAPGAFVYVALISLVGLVLFKKLQGLNGRKLVNPAAAAKFVVLLPLLGTVFLAIDHLSSGPLGVPALAGPLNLGIAPNFLSIGGNGMASFGTYLMGCFANPTAVPATTFENLSSLMILSKYHGWAGGASSIAVIIAGIALFIVARKYVKWRVTLAYFISIAAMSLVMSTVYADQDVLVRLLFEVFIGSSIFLGFFMATDPATTPFTGIGQIIFGIGLGILTVLIQTYMNFFGGSLLALLIMNLTVPLLDRVGIHKPFGR